MELITTTDGSHTLFVPELNEHYHSVNGAIQESSHVFLRAGFDQMQAGSFHILEFGFGTGLNALLTLLAAGSKGKQVYYTSIEKYPVKEEMAKALNYNTILCPGQPDVFMSLHRAEWGEDCHITPFFKLHKIEGDYNTCTWPSGIDLVYYDAFAPDKQPEVWNQSLFDRIYLSMNPGGILVTYCAKGAVRRMLQTAGFTVERLPGPPGKREMLRGIK